MKIIGRCVREFYKYISGTHEQCKIEYSNLAYDVACGLNKYLVREVDRKGIVRFPIKKYVAAINERPYVVLAHRQGSAFKFDVIDWDTFNEIALGLRNHYLMIGQKIMQVKVKFTLPPHGYVRLEIPVDMDTYRQWVKLIERYKVPPTLLIKKLIRQF